MAGASSPVVIGGEMEVEESLSLSDLTVSHSSRDPEYVQPRFAANRNFSSTTDTENGSASNPRHQIISEGTCTTDLPTYNNVLEYSINERRIT